jgi:hypothetical protein
LNAQALQDNASATTQIARNINLSPLIDAPPPTIA